MPGPQTGLSTLSTSLDAPVQGCFPCCGAVRTRGQDEQTARLGDFPADEKLWEGGEFRFCGSAIRYKKILFISIQARARHLSCVSGPAVTAAYTVKLAVTLTAQHPLVVCPRTAQPRDGWRSPPVRPACVSSDRPAPRCAAARRGADL